MKFNPHKKILQVLFFTGLFAAAGAANTEAQTGTSALNTVRPAVKNSDIVIKVSEIDKNAVFFPADIDGTRIEVLAVRAPDGTVRTAFNTCQVCYNSGRGFYRQEGSVLVCQNCGNRFRMSQVGVRAGGCNPVPIPEQYKQETDTKMTVPLALLKQAKSIFGNWKRS
ncbi:MAG TPA: DUF2318 domain-containing protein [Treponema sp.]|nr:DUF2318 domain-containing protein [Treponema sp.]